VRQSGPYTSAGRGVRRSEEMGGPIDLFVCVLHVYLCVCELYPWCMYGCLCVSLCLFMCACVCLCCVRFFKGAGIVEATVAQRQLVWPPCWMRISGWVTPAVIPVASSSVLVVNNSVPVPYYCIDLCKYP